MRIFSIAGLFLLIAAAAYGDVVRLKNGDQITGEFDGSDGSALTMKTEYAGDVKIKLEAVQELSTNDAFTVVSRTGSVLQGVLAASEGTISVKHGDGITSFPASEIEAIRSQAQQAVHEKQIARLRHPGWLDFWSGQADVGLSTTRGNTNTLNYSISSQVVRATPNDRTMLNFLSLFSQTDATGVATTTANVVRGGVRHDHRVSGKAFVFGFAEYEFNEEQNVDLRSVYGGGLGFELIRSSHVNWATFGGVSYNREAFATAQNRNSGEWLFSEELKYRPGPRLTLEHRASFFPGLADFGEHRLNLDLTASLRINSTLSWQTTFSDRYQSNPAPGTNRNDLLITTGVRFTFGREEYSGFATSLAGLLKK